MRDSILLVAAFAVLVCVLLTDVTTCRDPGPHAAPAGHAVSASTPDHCDPAHHRTHADAARHDVLSRTSDDLDVVASPSAEAAGPVVSASAGHDTASTGPPRAGRAWLLELCVIRT